MIDKFLEFLKCNDIDYKNSDTTIKILREEVAELESDVRSLEAEIEVLELQLDN